MQRYEEETLHANTQYANRYLSYYHDDEGCRVISARLPAEQGAALIKSIESAREVLLSERKSVPAGTFSEEANEIEPEFSEPFAAQRADALVLMAERFHSSDITTRNGGERWQVVIHVDEQVLRHPHSDGRCECEAGPVLASQTARRLTCDASLVRVVEDEHGQPLSVGRKTRSIPPALRRALQLRDTHCRFPGCNSRHFLDAHHIQHWANGGETKMDNLVHLWKHHHRLLHEGGYQMIHEASGALRFLTPKGNRICVYPQPMASDKSLEVMDLDLAVSGMYALAHQNMLE